MPATRRIWIGRTIAVLAGLLASAMLALVVSYPAAAAAACPSCYGFTAVAPDVFVERNASVLARTQAVDFVGAARKRVRAFYGSVVSAPRVLICASEDCYRRLGGGGSRGMALLDVALVLSARGADAVIATHEMSHIELHARLGMWRTWRRDIPQWFDEGVAVVVSQDSRYLGASGERCGADTGEPLPTSRSAWIERAGTEQLYAAAACRVSRWMAMRGGSGAVVGLVGEVAAGADFGTLYR